MIIKYIIDTFVTPKIETLNFVDRYSSVVSEVEITTHAKGGAKTYKKYPVAAGVTATDCNNESLYQDLVPNDSKNSVIYWELTQPMQNVGKTPNVTTFNQQRYRGTARIIVWLNMAKLGFSEVAPQNRTDGKIHTLPALMKAISFEGKLDSGIYANDNVTIVPQRIITDKAQIFGKYAYSKDRNWFLYPYDFFAIDVTFTLDTCLANPYEFPLGTAINCVDYSIPQESTPIEYSFSLDGVNESISLPSLPAYDAINNNTTFSLSIWIKPTSVSGNRAVINRYNATASHGIEMLIQNGTLRFIIGKSGNINLTTILIKTQNVVLTAGQWHHVVYTYDGSENASGCKIYVNGVLQPVIVTYDALSGAGDLHPAASWAVGKEQLVSNFIGLINIFRLWTLELSNSEVLLEYNNGAVLPVAVQNGNMLINPDFNNSTWTGATWQIPDITGVTSFYQTTNMEEGDRVTDVPN